MRLPKRIRKRFKPKASISIQLEQAYEKGQLLDSDMGAAANLIRWRVTVFKWNDAQFELVKDILDRAKKLKRYSLYAITDGESVKLGIAVDVKKRLINLQTAHSKKLGIIWQREVGLDKAYAFQLESDLHIRCRKHKLRGEWFSLECMALVFEFRS